MDFVFYIHLLPYLLLSIGLNWHLAASESYVADLLRAWIQCLMLLLFPRPNDQDLDSKIEQIRKKRTWSTLFYSLTSRHFYHTLLIVTTLIIYHSHLYILSKRPRFRPYMNELNARAFNSLSSMPKTRVVIKESNLLVKKMWQLKKAEIAKEERLSWNFTL